MKSRSRVVITAGLLSAFAAAAVAETDSSAGPVKVVFQAPEKFTDVKERQFKTAPEKNANLSELKKWLEKRATRQLPAGQRLEIAINDIDLAGAFEPWNAPAMQDIRIVKDMYPPRMKLHFQLFGADGSVLKEGNRDLRNLGFMMESGNIGRDALEHDKGLLEDWLKKEFPTEQ
ncbi:DUF3016 domain-containing protein [Permianibacter sp. IMCC34836]|uniref:DUF3016 domain-containing protein n=1 Tax=Permianibacter fluminis TaxID=2738515 RepID=UPI0015564C03|nr:DUF3016 domain-containing protein [Permianibacter fluminis]NQD36039.1 DUF3016 domain-containing protein [Permianibacter fluminis]